MGGREISELKVRERNSDRYAPEACVGCDSWTGGARLSAGVNSMDGCVDGALLVRVVHE